jgi:8-oxo-dGTP pyrophosphatase MutT (NUDIX family)
VYCLDFIRTRLADYRPHLFVPDGQMREAAVAVIVRPGAAGTDILFIKRAEKSGDPWSGHMAFPGGHREPSDADLRAAAERETLEEIGLDLRGADYLGPLDHQHAMARGRLLNMLIAPHVFAIEGTPTFAPNYEVQEVVWAPLDDLASNHRHATEMRPMAGTPTVFNGYRLEQGHFVWGLTYRMVKSFFSAIDPDWRPPQEV